jgi:hypothetical protein
LAVTYRVIQEESALLWEMIVWVILSKKVHTNMGIYWILRVHFCSCLHL